MSMAALCSKFSFLLRLVFSWQHFPCFRGAHCLLRAACRISKQQTKEKRNDSHHFRSFFLSFAVFGVLFSIDYRISVFLKYMYQASIFQRLSYGNFRNPTEYNRFPYMTCCRCIVLLYLKLHFLLYFKSRFFCAVDNSVPSGFIVFGACFHSY